MRLVCVSGACSRAGKTALATTLVEAFRGAAAVKFTTTEDVFTRCPRGTPCVVCDIDVPFRVIEDPGVLRQAGTDTARLVEAGAGRVVWAIARAHAVANAWDAVVRRLGRDTPVAVMEGSTIVDIAQPDLLLFVAHPHLAVTRWKPTSAALLARADAVVVNRPAADDRPPSGAVMRAIDRARPGRPPLVADVTRPLASWAPAIAAGIAAWNPVAAR